MIYEITIQRNTKKFWHLKSQWLWSESTDNRGFNTIYNFGPNRNPNNTLVALVELEDLVPIIREPFSSRYHQYQQFFRLLHIQAYVAQ